MPKAKADPVRQLRQCIIEVMREVGICPAPGCEREFWPSRDDQVYCSHACRKAAQRDRDSASGFNPDRDARV